MVVGVVSLLVKPCQIQCARAEMIARRTNMIETHANADAKAHVDTDRQQSLFFVMIYVAVVNVILVLCVVVIRLVLQ